jgi:hypothetical protein
MVAMKPITTAMRITGEKALDRAMAWRLEAW